MNRCKCCYCFIFNEQKYCTTCQSSMNINRECSLGENHTNGHMLTVISYLLFPEAEWFRQTNHATLARLQKSFLLYPHTERHHND